jgi:hypothetical protein
MIAEEEASWRRTLAMTEQAVKLPTEAVPLVVPPSPSTGVATDPEGMVLVTHSFLRRGPTAIIAALVVMFSATFAFLMRDLDNAKPAPAPAALVEPPVPAPKAAAAHAAPSPTKHTSPTPSPTHVTVTPIAAPPVRVSSDTPRTSMELADDREDLLEDPEPSDRDEPRQRTVSQKRTATKSPPSKPSRTVRPASTRSTAPAHTVAPSPPTRGTGTVDCSTPFYFEGSKKIFKPGCL